MAAPSVGDTGWIIPLGNGRYAFIPAEVPEVGDTVYVMPRQYGGYGAVPQFGMAVGDPVFVRPDPLGNPSFDALELGGRPDEGGYHEPTVLYDTGNVQVWPYACDPWVQFCDYYPNIGVDDYTVMVVNAETGIARTLYTFDTAVAPPKAIGYGDWAITWTTTAATLWDLSAGTSSTILTATGAPDSIQAAAISETGEAVICKYDTTGYGTLDFYTLDLDEGGTPAVDISVVGSRATGTAPKATSVAMTSTHVGITTYSATYGIARFYERGTGTAAGSDNNGAYGPAANIIATEGYFAWEAPLAGGYSKDHLWSLDTAGLLTWTGQAPPQTVFISDIDAAAGTLAFGSELVILSLPTFEETEVDDLSDYTDAEGAINGTFIAWAPQNEGVMWMRLAS